MFIFVAIFFFVANTNLFLEKKFANKKLRKRPTYDTKSTMTIPRFHALQSVFYFRKYIAAQQEEARAFFSRIRSDVNRQDIDLYLMYESKINLDWYNSNGGIEFQSRFVPILFRHISKYLQYHIDDVQCLRNISELIECYEIYLDMAWKNKNYEDEKRLFEYIDNDTLEGIQVFKFLKKLGMECVEDFDYAHSHHFETHSKVFSSDTKAEARALWQKYTAEPENVLI